MQERLEDDGFSERLIFSDEVEKSTATMSVCGALKIPMLPANMNAIHLKLMCFCAISNKKKSSWTVLLHQKHSHWDVLSGYVEKLADASTS
jgi:hypothetical protein